MLSVEYYRVRNAKETPGIKRLGGFPRLSLVGAILIFNPVSHLEFSAESSSIL